MAKAKTIKQGVVHLMNDGIRVTLRAGDRVPDWANITNPALLADVDEPTGDADAQQQQDGGGQEPANEPTGDTGSTGDSGSTGDTVEVSEKLSGDALRAIAGDLGLPTKGTKKELVASILAKRAEPADGADDSAPAAPDADTESGRASLEERARELGIDFDENTSDEELEALIEDEE